jgi:uncharacterized membrane protein
MKSFLQFFRTTLAGGILFLLPVVLVVILVGKAVGIAHRIVAPLANHLPVQSVLGLEAPTLVAIAVLVLFCFLAGVLARTTIARKTTDWLESTALSNLPGYQYFKAISRNLLAAEGQPERSVVLARIEDAWQIAFLTERLEDGHVAVFVPGTPNPQSGSVYFMTEDRIRPMDIPPTSALKCLKNYGIGSKAILGGHLGGRSPPVPAAGRH